MATTIDRIHAKVEAGYPALIGAVVGVLSLVYAPTAVEQIIARGWDLGNLYSAVFDVSAIVTPFLFTFYSFVVTTDRGFIGRAKGSIYYKTAIRFTVQALVLGGILTIVSIPMMVIEPAPVVRFGWEHFLLAGWAALAVGTLAAFVRAAHLFSIFARQHR